MRLMTPSLAGLAALALVATPLAPSASAATVEETHPQTPALNAQLPIIHTYRGSDHLRANVLNPMPVCNASEDLRTVVYRVTDHFLPVGTVSTTNRTQSPIPLTQTTSKQQTVSFSVNGQRSTSVSANLGGGASKDGNSVSYGISSTIAQQIGGSASYSLSWTVGQTVGPYQVPAGHTGEATYGFRAVTLSGTQQTCLPNGTWSTPTAWSAFTPVKNEIKVKLYDNAAGAIGGAGDGTPAQSTEFVATAEPKTPTPGDLAVPATKPAKDLSVRYTVAAGKAPGYAGLVGIRVKNEGTQQYYAEFPALTFQVKVKTASGPTGVDRLITPGWFNGAYTRDLGFDRATSTRTFEVTLSNPIEPGKEMLVANLNFGDGATKLGRLTNYVEVTQVGRVEGDTTYHNDYRIDSRKATTTDGGRGSAGLF